MKIACLILNYNDADTTLKLLMKIKNFKCFDDIVIVDNFSTDNSFDKMQCYRCSRIHIISTKKNGGYGYGNNYGINWINDNISSDYILICNPDVSFSEKFIYNLINVIDKDENCAVVSGMVKNEKGIIQYNCAWRIPTAIQYTFSLGLIGNFFTNSVCKMRYSKEYLTSESEVNVDCVAGSLLLVDVKKMLKYGMYDENVFLFCEETILGTKFKNFGFTTKLLTTDSYIHKHAVSMNKTFFPSFKGFMKKQLIWMQSRVYFMKCYLGVNKNISKIIYVYLFFVCIEKYFISYLEQFGKRVLKNEN